MPCPEALRLSVAVVVVEAAVAAMSVEWVEWHAAASRVAAWARAARGGTALIGTAPAIGTALATIGVATIGTAITGIMGIIIMAMM